MKFAIKSSEEDNEGAGKEVEVNPDPDVIPSAGIPFGDRHRLVAGEKGKQIPAFARMKPTDSSVGDSSSVGGFKIKGKHTFDGPESSREKGRFKKFLKLPRRKNKVKNGQSVFKARDTGEEGKEKGKKDDGRMMFKRKGEGSGEDGRSGTVFKRKDEGIEGNEGVKNKVSFKMKGNTKKGVEGKRALTFIRKEEGADGARGSGQGASFKIKGKIYGKGEERGDINAAPGKKMHSIPYAATEAVPEKGKFVVREEREPVDSIKPVFKRKEATGPGKKGADDTSELAEVVFRRRETPKFTKIEAASTTSPTEERKKVSFSRREAPDVAKEPSPVTEKAVKSVSFIKKKAVEVKDASAAPVKQARREAKIDGGRAHGKSKGWKLKRPRVTDFRKKEKGTPPRVWDTGSLLSSKIFIGSAISIITILVFLMITLFQAETESSVFWRMCLLPQLFIVYLVIVCGSYAFGVIMMGMGMVNRIREKRAEQ